MTQMPPFAPQSSPESQVSGPATGLLVTAGIGIALQVAGIFMNLLGVGMGAAARGDQPAWVNMASGTVGIVFNFIAIAIGVVVLLGALKMKRLESYGFALAASIVAMIPCFSPCCVLGLPIGIWALVVLMKPEVKAAFRG